VAVGTSSLVTAGMESILLSQTATADFSPNIEQKYVLNALALSSVLGMFLPFPHRSRSAQLLGLLFLRSFEKLIIVFQL